MQTQQRQTGNARYLSNHGRRAWAHHCFKFTPNHGHNSMWDLKGILLFHPSTPSKCLQSTKQFEHDRCEKRSPCIWPHARQAPPEGAKIIKKKGKKKVELLLRKGQPQKKKTKPQVVPFLTQSKYIAKHKRKTKIKKGKKSKTYNKV